MTLKQQMEEQWAATGCIDPLKPARWRVGYAGHLCQDRNSFILDEDDRGPLDPEAPF